MVNLIKTLWEVQSSSQASLRIRNPRVSANDYSTWCFKQTLFSHCEHHAQYCSRRQGEKSPMCSLPLVQSPLC